MLGSLTAPQDFDGSGLLLQAADLTMKRGRRNEAGSLQMDSLEVPRVAAPKSGMRIRCSDNLRKVGGEGGGRSDKPRRKKGNDTND